MARAALGITVREVEERTGVNKNTVSRYEAGKDILSGALRRLELLFQQEGIIFIDADEHGGPGIRMPAPKPERQPSPAPTKPNLRYHRRYEK